MCEVRHAPGHKSIAKIGSGHGPAALSPDCQTANSGSRALSDRRP